jgi:hypothetical protein
MFIRTWLVFLYLGHPFFLPAQESEVDVAQLLEIYFQDHETIDPDAVQWLPDHLEYLLHHPLSLNEAERTSLSSLGLLQPIQIEHFLTYRSRLGPLLSLYELQAIPEWTVETIRLIRPFIRVGSSSLDQRARPLWNGIYQGNNELTYQLQRPQKAVMATDFEGSPLGIGLRFRHQFDGRVRFGVTLEKDPGEAFLQKSNPQGFDFNSFHFFIEEKKHPWFRKLALGDYNVQLGQGLLIQTGYNPGKSAETVQLYRNSKGILPYSGFGEALFLRGLGAQIRVRPKLEALFFASGRRKDAAVDTLITDDQETVFFTGLQTAGLHRNPTELAAEQQVKEGMIGGSLTHSFASGHVSSNWVYTWLDTDRASRPLPYRLYQFRGNRLLTSSFDYLLRKQNHLFFGENAMSQNGGWALTNGMIMGVDRRASLVLFFRELAPTFQTLYGAAFAETTGAANERGWYLGVEFRPSKSIRINGFVDLWKHPWLRYRVSAPSNGSEYLLRWSWQPSRNLSIYLLAQSRRKMQNEVNASNGLVAIDRNRFRFHLQYKLGRGMEYRCRLEWISLTSASQPLGTGFLGYQELVAKPKNSSVSGSIRFALFDTDTYDSRVYAFENALFSAISIPALAGRGSRWYAIVRWKAHQNWRLDARLEATFIDRSVSSSTQVGIQPGIQVQGRFYW